MNDELISMFIDDELDLDDKIELIERAADNVSFSEEALILLHQEKILRSDVTGAMPEITIEEKRDLQWRMLIRPAGLVGSAVAAALIIFFLFLPSPPDTGTTVPHRFVIYQPDVTRVELAGSFNAWRPIPLKQIGSSGYWEVTMQLPQGEHRYSYILEGTQKYADPTVTTREQDDFGGVNSVLVVDI